MVPGFSSHFLVYWTVACILHARISSVSPSAEVLPIYTLRIITFARARPCSPSSLFFVRDTSSSLLLFLFLLSFYSSSCNTRLSLSHAASVPAAAPCPSLAALRARFSRMICFRSSSTAACRSSTPCSQYPKLPPTPAKTGYAHSELRLKSGRISRPSCQRRTATPAWRGGGLASHSSFPLFFSWQVGSWCGVVWCGASGSS